MSIATEISRLQTAKSNMKTAIEAKGVSVPSTATVSTYDYYINQISGGGSTYITREVSGTPYCDSRDLYVDVTYQISVNNGETWITSGSPYSVLVETGSSECIDFSTSYLTFVAEADGVSFATNGTSSNVFQYSLDNGTTWVNLTVGNTTPSINNGEKILWKASSNLTVNQETGIGIIRPSAAARVEGNIMSMLYDDNFTGQTVIPYSYNLRKFFSGATNITSAENLVLPATTLKKQCYSQMFQGCTSLTATPITIGSTAMTWGGEYCMSNMFSDCTSLVHPSPTLLPALNLGTRCYWCLFEGSSAITESPILSAQTLVTECYRALFFNCSSLSSITCLATNPSESITKGWTIGVQTTSGTFTKEASASWSTGTNGVPNNWTIVNYTS